MYSKVRQDATLIKELIKSKWKAEAEAVNQKYGSQGKSYERLKQNNLKVVWSEFSTLS
jgi:hypothetical protein